MTRPDDTPGVYCFLGTVFLDGPGEPIGGDRCLSPGAPALPEWGAVAMTLLLLTTASIALLRRPAPSAHTANPAGEAGH